MNSQTQHNTIQDVLTHRQLDNNNTTNSQHNTTVLRKGKQETGVEKLKLKKGQQQCTCHCHDERFKYN